MIKRPRKPPMSQRLARHFLMGVALGLMLTILLLATNSHLRQLIAWSADPDGSLLGFSVFLSFTIGFGAMFTGFVFESRENEGDSRRF